MPAPSRAPRSRRARALDTAASLLARLDQHEAALYAPVTDVTSAKRLYFHQQQYVPELTRSAMNAGAQLIELLQREARQAHARQLPQMHSILLRLGSRTMDAPLTALAAWRDNEARHSHGAAQTLTDEPVHIRMMADDMLDRALTETYATVGAVWECATELRVRRACAKWLAHLAQRYVMALDAGLSMHDIWWPLEREAWRITAANWFSRTAADEPDQAYAYLGLAAVHCAEPLAALYFLCKSLQTVHPTPNTHEALHAWAMERTQGATDPNSAVIQALAQLILRKEDEAPCNEPLALDLLETEWAELGVCITGALLEFGHPHATLEARILAAHGTPSHARVDASQCVKTLQTFLQGAQAFCTPPLAPCDVMRLCEARGLSAPLRHAIRLYLLLLQTALAELASTPAPGVFVMLTLSFLQVLTLSTHIPAVDALCYVLKAALPWDQLMTYVRREALLPGAPSAEAQWRLALAHSPDDWYFRGLSWPTWAPAVSAPGSECETDMLAHRRATALRAQTRPDTTPTSMEGRHARTTLLVALLHTQLAHYDASSLA